MDMGAVTVFLLSFTEREKIYNLAEAISGARLTTSYTRIGGVMRDLPPNWLDQCQKFCDEFIPALNEFETLLTRNRIWVDRVRDLAVISKEDAIDYGLSGPNLRGSGVEWDLRKNQPYLCYKDLEFDIPTGAVGDCYDRYLVRMEEMRQSVRILEQCIKKIPGGADNKTNEPVNVADGKITLPQKQKVLSSMEELIHQFMLVTEGVNCPPGEIYFGHENPKGELGFYINSKGGGTPYRMKIRAPSFVNLSIVPKIFPGMPDQRHRGDSRLARLCDGGMRPMSFQATSQLEAEVNELISHYPVKRAASLMVLHAIQEQFGWISSEAVQWTAKKLELQPINVFEILTFYPMLRQQPMGKYQIKVCRTLSCALGGGYELHKHFCDKLGLDAHAHGPQTTKDGKFTVEFVECLASCGTAPVMMCNDAFYEGVSHKKADEIVAGCG